VLSSIELGVKEGADLVVDGRGFSLQGYENGFFPGFAVRSGHARDEDYQDEIFGPVLQVARAPDFEAALALPSNHQYGNGVAIFTRDGDSAREFASKVKVGMIGINIPIPVPLAYHTFGRLEAVGVRRREPARPEGVRFFTRIKTVTQRWPKGGLREHPRIQHPDNDMTRERTAANVVI